MTIDNRRGAKMYPIMSGERTGLAASAARAALSALSRVYQSGYERRMARLLRSEKDRIGVPVVSVGNITVGGTGKTPVCLYLAKVFSAGGRKVGIATRGYGREGGGTVILREACDARSWHACGDEPMLYLAEPAVAAIAVDADRARAARLLVEQAGCDIVLLDDGFQFVTLHRDVDIVVLDAGNPFGYEKLLPAGLLREPLGCLARADVLWLAKADSVSGGRRLEIRERIAKEQPGKPVVESRYEPAELVSYKQNGPAPGIAELAGAKILCVSGIGNPDSFERLVARLAGSPPLAIRFQDHHPFGDGDLSRVEDEAVRAGADFIVTTEKDAARLPGHFRPRGRWLILKIGVAVSDGGEIIEKILSLPENLFRE